MTAPSILELRRSYWWADRYINSLYISEYHSRTPLYSKIWVYPYIVTHPAGAGVLYEFTACVTPSVFHPFSTEHKTWSYVHNTTRDYSLISLIGFEDTEPDWFVCQYDGTLCPNPVGLPFPHYNSDCDDPLMIVEYTRNRVKNGFFEFRQYASVPSGCGWATTVYDYPAFWDVNIVADAGKKAPCVSLAPGYNSRYAVEVLIHEGGMAELSQSGIEVLPDTEYVASLYLLGHVERATHFFRVELYDAAGNLVGSPQVILPEGSYLEWEDFELRFRTTQDTVYARIVIAVDARGTDAYFVCWFDTVWLSECPVNLYPNYRLSVQIEDYQGPFESDIYCQGVKLFGSVSTNNIPRNVAEILLPLDGVPAFRSAIRHSVTSGAYYYKHTSMSSDWNTRAADLESFRDDYGFTYDYYHPLYRESDSYPDDFMFSEECFHDCEVWFLLQPPHSEAVRQATFYPYWSKVCICKSASILGLSIKNPYFVSLLAIHLVNKYRDPFMQVSLSGFMSEPALVSAYSLLFEGVGVVPPLSSWIDPDKGWNRGDSVYSIYAAACAMAAFAELGYGFQGEMEAAGYSSEAALARDYADRIALTLLKNQWGAHEQNGGIVWKPGYDFHEDFEEVYLPECTGGFNVLTVYKNGVPYATSRKDWVTQFSDIFNMPPETVGMIPVNLETTMVCTRALQIYEWYKYKGGKGVFPKLLLPADIDGDGWISELDVGLIEVNLENGYYHPLFDINVDGVIDVADLNIVKSFVGRGVPRQGIMWRPKSAKTSVTVEQTIIV